MFGHNSKYTVFTPPCAGDRGTPVLSAAVKFEGPEQDQEVLSGYRHFFETGYCMSFLQMRPCGCPPEGHMHKVRHGGPGTGGVSALLGDSCMGIVATRG